MIYFAVFVCSANVALNDHLPDDNCFLMSGVVDTYAVVPHPEAFIQRNLEHCHKIAGEAAELVAQHRGKQLTVRPPSESDPRYVIVYNGRPLEWTECRRLSWEGAQ